MNTIHITISEYDQDHMIYEWSHEGSNYAVLWDSETTMTEFMVNDKTKDGPKVPDQDVTRYVTENIVEAGGWTLWERIF